MMTADILWRALIHASILCGLVLTLGTFVLWFVRQPADRLRVIQWVLVGRLIAPWLPGISAWKTISLNLLQRDQYDARTVRVSANLRPGVVTTEARILEPKIALESLTPEPMSPSAEAVSTPSTVDITRLRITTAESAIAPRSIGSAPETQQPRNLGTFSLSAIPSLIVFVYLSAVAATMGWWAVGLRRRNWLERSARPASLEMQQKLASMAHTGQAPVRLLVSEQVSGPMTWGLVRPVIIVPSQLTDPLNESQLRWSLAHELSHIERRDVATLLLASLVQLSCFYQPFYWWLRRQMSLCQDFLADAKAARETGSAEDYAEFLVNLARSRIQPSLPAALGIAEGKSRLYRRIKFLLTFQGMIASTCSGVTALCSAVIATSFFTLLTTIGLEADDSQPGTIAIVQPKQIAPTPKENNGSEQTRSKLSAPASATATDQIQKLDKQAANRNTIAAPSLIPVDESEFEQDVVTGVCVTADGGEPVPNATVILHAGRSDKTKTNEKGEFRLEQIPAREYAYPVWAHQGNLVSKKVSVSALKNDDPKIVKFAPLVLEMTEGKKVRFVVTSEVTNKPVAGANVRFGYPDRRQVKTDEQGMATVEGLLPENYEVSIDAPGHARNAPSIDLSSAGAVTEFNISLKAGALVRGTVSDVSGKPVPGATVSYYSAGSPYGYGGDAFVTSDEGRFQNSNLPFDTSIRIYVSKKGYVPQNQQILATADNRELEVRLTLPSLPVGGSIQGTVRNEEGKPVADVEILNYGNGSSEIQKAKTTADGKFELRDMLRGFAGHEIVVMAKGYAPQHLTVTPGTAEKPGTADITLKPGHRIRGRIELSDGTSPKGAHILARSPQFGTMPGFRVTSADEKGAFELDSLPTDARFDVNLKDYHALQGVTWKLDGNDPIIVNIAAPGVLRGRVLDQQTRQPISDFRIKLGFSRQKHPKDPVGTYKGEWGDRGLTFKSVKGEFAFTPLLVGFPAELTVEAQGYDRQLVERAVATKADQSDAIDVYLKRMKSADTFTLKGQLLNHLGEPAPEAQLRLIVSADQPQGAHDNNFNWALIDSEQLGQKSYCVQYLPGKTDAEGRFEFKGIQANRYLQLAYWGKGVPRAKSLAFDETVGGGRDDVTIRLPRPARVTGTIDRTKIADADGARLSMQTHDFHQYELKLIDDQTTFAFDDLPPGKYWISVIAKPVSFVEKGNTFYSSANLASKQIQLKPGQVEELKFIELDAPTP